MAASNSSVRGGNNEEEEPPISRAELRQLGNSLLEAMERMLNEHLPPNGGRDPQQQNEEFGDKNSSFGCNIQVVRNLDTKFGYLVYVCFDVYEWYKELGAYL
jgi:hypothetical protein